MIRKSAQRFSEKIMLEPTQSAMTIHPNRIALWSFGSDEQNRSSEFPFLTRLLHANRGSAISHAHHAPTAINPIMVRHETQATTTV
jgi:hypothetical protein